MTSSAVDIPKTVGALLVGGLFASVWLSSESHPRRGFHLPPASPGSLTSKHCSTLDPTGMTPYASNCWSVASVWVMDTIHIGLLWGALWFYLITSYAMPAAIDQIPTASSVSAKTGKQGRLEDDSWLTENLHRSFFGYRVFMLSKRNWWLTTPVVVLLCLRLVCAVAEISDLDQDELISLTLIVPAGLDAFTTGALVYLLRQHRGENGRWATGQFFYDEADTVRSSNHILDKLLLLPDIWLLMKDNLIFAGVFCCMGKFYTNVLFAR
ncbi:hypothetical protein FB45DRAFT_871263 [Roridomyces roridus]|uniref:Uncharacterized protein n=1 Tax=Roridomyces roridus TaxID=1738132 RepID=A0AAD7BGK1_9AGAR|nr:hypothetical protein FB45DRAFT_871263 [Roridomyces roridus]